MIVNIISLIMDHRRRQKHGSLVGVIRQHQPSLEYQLSEKRCIDFIVGTWVTDGHLTNFEMPDGRVVSLNNSAVGSKRKAIVIHSRVMRIHYSPTSETSLRKILNNANTI